MRLPRAFYVLMLPFVYTAVSMPSQLEALLQHQPSQQAAATTPVAAPSGGTLRIRADSQGHFNVFGTIGGRRLPFLVDTGATQVALTYAVGRDLGLVRPGDPTNASVNTANGTVDAYAVRLPVLTVEAIQVTDIPALVLPEGALDVNLLGMSFLKRLKRFEMANATLVLER